MEGRYLKRFADREEMVVVDIYEDAGKSGKSIEGRPAFKQMLSDIENGLQIEYILVLIEAIRELVSNETFAKEVKSRIGTSD
ncbi:recombinase family protein [Desulfosporosinus nitroreducens]|uniref:recombinase family protein n=1 Tax=Desulfosporosinus nitroreducens TaxID=2018668 RepID=UPI0035A39C4A